MYASSRVGEVQSPTNLVKLLWALVFKEHRVCGAYVLLVVVVANNLHVVETELDFDALVGWGEETQGVEGELELGADADEDASLRLYAVLPAELQRQDVFVLVWLQSDRKDEMLSFHKRQERRWAKGKRSEGAW